MMESTGSCVFPLCEGPSAWHSGGADQELGFPTGASSLSEHHTSPLAGLGTTATGSPASDLQYCSHW